jgi:(4S)-4-hydroxy-5-phosphonooxypentane-2,3-dione isomerase
MPIPTLLAKLTAKPGHEADLHAALEAAVRAVDAAEPGVLAYTMHTVVGEPGTFWFYEQYADDDAIAAHRSSPHLATLITAVRDHADGGIEVIRLTPVCGIRR